MIYEASAEVTCEYDYVARISRDLKSLVRDYRTEKSPTFINERH